MAAVNIPCDPQRQPHDWPDRAPQHRPIPPRYAAIAACVADQAASEGIDLAEARSARNRCDDMSARYVAAAGAAGLKARMVMVAFRYLGEDLISVHHSVAVLPGRRVVDLTANQYADPGEKFPLPYSPDLAAWKRWLDEVQFAKKYRPPVQLDVTGLDLPDTLGRLADLKARAGGRAR